MGYGLDWLLFGFALVLMVAVWDSGWFARWVAARVREFRPGLLLSVVAVLAVALVVAALVAWVIGWAAYGSSWSVPAGPGESESVFGPVRLALTVVAGAGAAVALVVAFRRQRMNERGELREQFVTAAAQLGDADPTVRLAGVYALANLADAWPQQRQQCVDVLCARLRLPWVHEMDPDHPLATKTVEKTHRQTKTVYAYPDQTGELEVRATILRVIADHCQPEMRGTRWSDLRFDLTGAVLPELDWSFTVLADARFTRATFTEAARFVHVDFAGSAWFGGADFAGSAWFGGAEFTLEAEFRGATFTGEAWFGGATFCGPVLFRGATFTGAAGFERATFTGPASFEGATFARAAGFERATFSREPVGLDKKYLVDAKVLSRVEEP